MGHELLGDLFRERRLEAAPNVNGHQFLVLTLSICMQFQALTREFGLFGVGLGLN